MLDPAAFSMWMKMKFGSYDKSIGGELSTGRVFFQQRREDVLRCVAKQGTRIRGRDTFKSDFAKLSVYPVVEAAQLKLRQHLVRVGWVRRSFVYGIDSRFVAKLWKAFVHCKSVQPQIQSVIFR